MGVSIPTAATGLTGQTQTYFQGFAESMTKDSPTGWFSNEWIIEFARRVKISWSHLLMYVPLQSTYVVTLASR